MNQYFLQSKQLNAYRGRKFCISMYPSIFVDGIFSFFFSFLEDEEDLDDETRNRIKTKADRTNDFVDLEIMYPTSPRDLHNYLIPIKIMKFMNEYYFVPNNPILYLERVCFSLTFNLSRRIKRSQNLYCAPFLFEFSF